MKRVNKPHLGIFSKLSFIFVTGGILPLLIIGRFFLIEFTSNTQNVLLNQANIILQSASGYVDSLLIEWKDKTVALYTQQVEEGMDLGSMVLDGSIEPEQKSILMRRYLSELSTMNGLKSIRFLDKYGNIYYISEVVGKIVNTEEMQRFRKEELVKQSTKRGMMLTPVHKDIYFSNINDEVITIKRNLYDVTSVKSVDDYLGSIYLDVSKSILEQQLSSIDVGSRSGFYIIDQSGIEIYRDDNQSFLSLEKTKKLLDEMKTTNKSYLEDEDSYFLYKENIDGGWISMVRIHKADIMENVKMTKHYMITILFISCVLLLGFYFIFSVRISAPIRKLKAGMEQIKEGDLTTQVHIKSKDEIGILADGLNQMAMQLNEYIEKVYGAEIKQKEAELSALKSQIKPHYLYNTLEVIRMTAITNNDIQTAEMVESLARQLRYLISGQNDVISLEKELENITDYFKLMKIRYDDRIELKKSIPDKLKKMPVLKLILQPIVENAIKHGLRPKTGKGMIWISAKNMGEVLEISVMDDGVGMSEDRLKELLESIECESLGATKEELKGIGLRNIRDRIRKNFGIEYGLTIQSSLGAGTIVILHIPYIEEVVEYAKSDTN